MARGDRFNETIFKSITARGEEEKRRVWIFHPFLSVKIFQNSVRLQLLEEKELSW